MKLKDINAFKHRKKEFVSVILRLNKSNIRSKMTEKSKIIRYINNAYKLSNNIDIIEQQKAE